MKRSDKVYITFLACALAVVLFITYEARQVSLGLEELLKDVEELSEASKQSAEEARLLEEIAKTLHDPQDDPGGEQPD